jgi:hypothetical protein
MYKDFLSYTQRLPSIAIGLQASISEQQDLTRIPHQFQAAFAKSLRENSRDDFAHWCAPHNPQKLPEGWLRMPQNRQDTLVMVTFGKLAASVDKWAFVLPQVIENIPGIELQSTPEIRYLAELTPPTQPVDITVNTNTPVLCTHKGKPLLRGLLAPRVMTRTVAERFRRMYQQWDPRCAPDLPPLLGSIINSAGESKTRNVETDTVGFAIEASQGERFCRGMIGSWEYTSCDPAMVACLQWGVAAHAGKHISHGFGQYHLGYCSTPSKE